MSDKKNKEKTFKAIGSKVPRVDGIDKVTGRAKYGADYDVTGQLYGSVKYSDFPHARINSIDIAMAKSLPGVRAGLGRR